MKGGVFGAAHQVGDYAFSPAARSMTSHARASLPRRL
jgi:hypothetical protein